MLRMEQERNVVLKIRERIDQAREQPNGRTLGPQDLRVRLASPQKRISAGYALRKLTSYLSYSELETALHRFVMSNVERNASKASVLDRTVSTKSSIVGAKHQFNIGITGYTLLLAARALCLPGFSNH